MSAQTSQQLHNWHFVNTIQLLDELVDRVFRQHHFAAVPSFSSTVPSVVVQEFPAMEKLILVLAGC